MIVFAEDNDKETLEGKSQYKQNRKRKENMQEIVIKQKTNKYLLTHKKEQNKTKKKPLKNS